MHEWIGRKVMIMTDIGKKGQCGDENETRKTTDAFDENNDGYKGRTNHS
jgi:hypothetical protein